MADPVYVTAAPTLETVTRLTNGTINVTWTNNATSHTAYTAIYLMARKVGSGLWGQANSFGYPTISNQQYNQFTKPGGGAFPVNEAWEFMLKAYSTGGKMSPDGNSKSVSAETTDPPTFTAADRRSEAQVRLYFDPNPDGAATITTTYVWMRVEGSGASFKQVNATSNGAQSVIDVNGLIGRYSYEFELSSSGPAGLSERSSRKTADAWWVLPSGVSDLVGAWVTGNTGIKLTWTGNPTTRGRYVTQEVWRADGPLGQLRAITTIAGTLRTYTDTTASPAVAYRYQIVPRSDLGLATSRPEESVAAALQVPNEPTAVTATYLATDKAVVSWTRNPTVDRVYTSQRVIRADVGSDVWVQVGGLLSGTATTVTDTLGANRHVRYAVEAINAAGSSQSDATTPFASTPAAPATLSAAWTGPTTITVSWPDVSTIADTFNLEFSTDNVTWYPAPVTTPIDPAGANTWPHSPVVPTVPHWYRMNATKASVAGTPASTWVLSTLVPALTTPLAPTLVAPTVVDATEAVVLGFIHNPVDGTTQTAAEERYRVQGASTWTTVALTTATSVTIPAGTYTNGTILEVQARTAGATGDWSPWSASMLVTLRPRPVVNAVTNSSPTSSTVTTTWTVTAQTSAVVELLNGAGQPVLSRTVGAATRTTTWTGLPDQATYSTRVTASDQYQPSLPVTSAPFTITLVRPGKPTATAEFRTEDGSVLITGTAGTGVTDHMEAWRGDTLVGTLVSGMIVDDYPPLGQAGLIYTVRAYSPDGGFINSDPVAVTTTVCDIYVTWEGGVCRGGWDLSVDGAAGRETVAHRYVGDTEGPSFSYGQKLARTVDVSVSIDTATGDTPVDGWIDAAEDGRVVYRDPSGRVINGTLTTFRFGDSDILEQQVSFTITRRPDTAPTPSRQGGYMYTVQPSPTYPDALRITYPTTLSQSPGIIRFPLGV